VLNQVLVRWSAPDGQDPDGFNDAVIEAIQREGTTYVSGTTWRERRMMRISVADWATDEGDVDRAVEAMLRAAGRLASSV
jgi:glutamate/tyrosine decarboxylase-like PLP-dependent enzyme